MKVIDAMIKISRGEKVRFEILNDENHIYSSTNGMIKKKVDAYLSRKAYCLSDLCFDEVISFSRYYSELPQMLNAINGYWMQFNEWCRSDEKQKFLNNPTGTEVVKCLLDAMMELCHKSTRSTRVSITNSYPSMRNLTHSSCYIIR